MGYGGIASGGSDYKVYSQKRDHEAVVRQPSDKVNCRNGQMWRGP